MSAGAADPRLSRFPAELRELVEAELAVGNAIVEFGGSFPAPPAGGYVKLAKPVTTRPRASTATLSFYDRNTSLYSGEWTDAKRFFFVLEPPRPPPPEPDMNAIRAAQNVSVRMPAFPARREPPTAHARSAVPGRPAARSDGSSLVERFRASMAIDYEKWHDGIGYDLALLRSAIAQDRKEIEDILIGKGVSNWRDVEALAALNTPRAKKALKRALETGKLEVRAAVLEYAPHLVSEDDRTSLLIEGLRTADFFGGLTQVLDQVEKHHPPEIVAELLRGTLERNGEAAVHFAAMLMFVHGKAEEPFDWAHRPFLLRFNTDNRAEREAAFRELCGKIGVDAAGYLGRGRE